jgi:hypothetical protein
MPFCEPLTNDTARRLNAILVWHSIFLKLAAFDEKPCVVLSLDHTLKKKESNSERAFHCKFPMFHKAAVYVHAANRQCIFILLPEGATHLSLLKASTATMSPSTARFISAPRVKTTAYLPPRVFIQPSLEFSLETEKEET